MEELEATALAQARKDALLLIGRSILKQVSRSFTINPIEAPDLMSGHNPDKE